MEIQQRLPNGPTNPQSEEAVCALSLYWVKPIRGRHAGIGAIVAGATALPSLVKAV